MLLLDGFDEISSKMRMDILSEIISLNRRHGVQIITTSRGGTEICTESNIINYTVNKIKRSDIMSMLKRKHQPGRDNELSIACHAVLYLLSTFGLNP